MKYSVIIPVYNAEKTIQRCLDSLLKQHRQDVEILIVNDGSTDESGSICKNYAQQYSCIRYFEKENGGVSSARNLGLEKAKGEYILFVDSDDYVAENYFAGLDQADSKWDYVVAAYFVANAEDITKAPRTACAISETDPFFSKIGEWIYKMRLNALWNKRFKRDILKKNGIGFNTQLSLGEDMLFNLQYVLACSSCYVLEDPLYYESIEEQDSLSRKPRRDLKEQLALSVIEMRKEIQESKLTEENKQKLQEAVNFLQMRDVYSGAKLMHKAGEKWLARRREIRKMCKEFNQKELTLPGSRYCKLLHFPVKLRLITVLDYAGWKLAR